MVSRIENTNRYQSATKTYWCHLCKCEFSKIYVEDTDIRCRDCGKTFCEEIVSSNNDDHPSQYTPFVVNEAQSRRRLNETSPILDMLQSLISFNEDAHMENIISYLMANDPNKYGNPPASQEEVKKLRKVTVDEINKEEIRKMSSEHLCSVCKDDYEMGQNLIQLPCTHLFHDDCILPWLKERNSCPTCRYELKTDDNEYEARKAEKRNEIRRDTSI